MKYAVTAKTTVYKENNPTRRTVLSKSHYMHETLKQDGLAEFPAGAEQRKDKILKFLTGLTVNEMFEIAFNHCDAKGDDSAQYRLTTVEDLGGPVSWNLVTMKSTTLKVLSITR